MSESPNIIRIVVHGQPVPQGSKQARVITRKGAGGKREVVWKNGQPVVVVAESNRDALKGWRKAVAGRAVEQYDGAPIDSPVAVRLRFLMPRPDGHYGTGRNAHRLKPSAPIYPAVAPDVDKLERAILDAITGVVISNDSRVYQCVASKVYVERDEQPGVIIEVREASVVTVGQREAIEEEERAPQLALVS